MRSVFLLLFIAGLHGTSPGRVLHTGPGQPYTNITAAAGAADPGDTILMHRGIYAGNQQLRGLQGTANHWVYILAAEKGAVVFEGGTAAWKGSSAAYLHIEGIVFTGQTGNGLNIDDGSNAASPAHHIVFRHCTFRNIAATGNNDLLKLSGVDDFSILQCTFLNGSPGGSGIDMVGCHNGVIRQCRFENMGANAIQMKGGSRNILIEGCLFKNAGSRAINLGGSTGIAFFRPADASYEAAELKVYSNVFTGSEVPVAFVGCIQSEVINNTIYKPGRWVIRILQENKDTLRFAKCGSNSFRNNMVYVDSQLRTACSIGPGTAAESFSFSNNLWFYAGNAGWPGPQLPAAEKNGLIGKDPMFGDADKGDFTIAAGSAGDAARLSLPFPEKDYTGARYRKPGAIGAFEVKE